MQRGAPFPVLGIDVGAELQQGLDHLVAAVDNRFKQGGAASVVTHIHVGAPFHQKRDHCVRIASGGFVVEDAIALVHRCVGIRSNIEEILGHVPVIQVDGVVQSRLALVIR